LHSRCGAAHSSGWRPSERCPRYRKTLFPPKVNVATPAGLNIADGYFQLTATDLSVGTLKLERFTLPPAALAVDAPFFGAGITHNFDIYVAVNFIKAFGQPYPEASTYHPVVHIGSGASGTFQQTGPLSTTVNPLTLEAYKGVLTIVSGAYVYTDSNGVIYTFNSAIRAGGGSGQYSQRVDNILYADGRRENFAYNASGQLKMVSDTAGYAIIFDYNATGGVSAACGFNLARDYVTATSTCTGAGLKATYSYTAIGTVQTLTSATNVLSQIDGYAHDGSGYGYPITCLTPAGYASCKIVNTVGGYGQIYQQTLAGGGAWSLSFDTGCTPDPDYPESRGAICYVDMTDPNSQISHLTFYKSSPTKIIDASGKATSYHWKGSVIPDPNYDQTLQGPYLTEADFPEGNKYLAEYQGPFNLISKATSVAKLGSSLANRVETWGYGSCLSPGTYQNCGKPIWKKDANGNQTDFSFTSFGGTISEMRPAPNLGAARPLKLYSYVQKSAFILNGGGLLVSTGSPIWLPATETTCQTVAGSSSPVCDTSAPQAVTTYQYGADGTADNLLLRGAAIASGGVTKRSCYTYDSFSRKISETSPSANLAVCP
jgi:hypothetical protein